MKTIANLAIIGLASALRLQEGREAEDLDMVCAQIAEIPDDATWEDISAKIVEKTGETMEEAEFEELVAACFAGDDDEDEDDDEDADEFDGTTDGSDDEGDDVDSQDSSTEGSDSSDDEDGDASSGDSSSDTDDGESSSDTDDGDDDDASSEGSMDGSMTDSVFEDDSSAGSLTSDEGSDDEGDEEWDEDDEAEFKAICEEIAMIPEDATWEDDIAPQLQADFGDEAPTQEEFDGLVAACVLAAEEYGEEGDDEEAEEMAQIKDVDITPEEMAAHCGDVAALKADVDHNDWDASLAWIVQRFGEEGLPTKAEFDAVVEFCEAQ